MKCLNCGSEVSSYDEECKVCGKKISVFTNDSFKSDYEIDSYGAYDPRKDSTNFSNSKTPYGTRVKRRSDTSLLTKLLGLAVVVFLIYIIAGATGILGIDDGKYEIIQIKEGSTIHKVDGINSEYGKIRVGLVLKDGKYTAYGKMGDTEVRNGSGSYKTFLTNITLKADGEKVEGRFNWFTKTITIEKDDVEIKFKKK